jgi:hypothetical protein
MKKRVVKTTDISVVVQGAIDEKLTPKCLNSIRKCLPGAKIILSTWEDSNIEGLDYDVLLENGDPGAEICDVVHNVKNNVNRQILSTRNGLKFVKTIYAMKLRSDMCLKNTNFLSYFNKFQNFRNQECCILKNRVVTNNLYCADPHKTNCYFHISDWVHFGLTEDLLNIWDIPLQNEPGSSRYFLNKKRPIFDPVPSWLFQYIPEQYIWTTFLRKNGIYFDFKYFTDISPKNLMLSELSFANNIIIVDYEKFGIEFLKFDPYKWDYTKQLTHYLWWKMYKKYCHQGFSMHLDFWQEFLMMKDKFNKKCLKFFCNYLQKNLKFDLI